MVNVQLAVTQEQKFEPEHAQSHWLHMVEESVLENQQKVLFVTIIYVQVSQLNKTSLKPYCLDFL